MTTRFEIVPFHGQEILTVNDGSGVLVVVRPIVEAMGLDWSAQYRRISRHPVIAEGVAVMATPSGGGAQDAVCLSLEAFHGWLMTISPDRIGNAQTRELVIRYQREAFRVVFEHFHGPLRIAAPKPASMADFASTVTRLKLERNRAARALLWERLDQIADSWGVTRAERAIGYAEPDYAEELADFWAAVAAVDAAGIPTNHSRSNDLIALNLPELAQHFAALDIDLLIDRDLRAALRHSITPRFVDMKKVNSRDGRTRSCWVFRHVSEDEPCP